MMMNQYDFDSLMLQQIRGSVEDIEKLSKEYSRLKGERDSKLEKWMEISS